MPWLLLREKNQSVSLKVGNAGNGILENLLSVFSV